MEENGSIDVICHQVRRSHRLLGGSTPEPDPTELDPGPDACRDPKDYPIKFTLSHEIGHVLRHLSPENPAILDLDIDQKKNGAIEVEADRFALDTLIPPDAWSEQVRHLHYAAG